MPIVYLFIVPFLSSQIIRYAEHAGAARDLAKLAKLGRLGENGSVEVAQAYAKRCSVEVEEASALLDVLSNSIQ